ncbi:MAG: aldo/keto reductase [Luteibacter sp.]
MRYRPFGRGTGLIVSEIVLGAGMFGTRWGYGAEPAESRRIVDGYLDGGGTFIDTADTYQVGEAEELLGQFLQGKREDVVLASKYTMGEVNGAGLLALGNGRKNMLRSVDASLSRLRTDYLDVYYTHVPDELTSVDEIQRGMEDLIRAGKVRYFGLSDFPAWRVARAATLAELRGTAPVAAIQFEYSLVARTPESEILPMGDAFGLGMVGWSPLGGGLLTGKYRRGETGRATGFKRLIHDEDSPRKEATVDAVLAVADELGVSPGQVAIAWLATRGVLPIIGPRTREQLDDNLGASAVVFSADQLHRLDAASAIPMGFPHEMNATQHERLRAGMPDRVVEDGAPVR